MITKTRKYEFIGHTSQKSRYRKLQRIRALITIPGVVEAGELGGWIEDENNLHHEGSCWVGDEACVCESATVIGNAVAKGQSQLYGRSMVRGAAVIANTAILNDQVMVEDEAFVGGELELSGAIVVGGKTELRLSNQIINAGGVGIAAFYAYRNVDDTIRISDGVRSYRLEDFVVAEQLAKYRKPEQASDFEHCMHHLLLAMNSRGWDWKGKIQIARP